MRFFLPSDDNQYKFKRKQFSGSGSGWIRIIWPDPDPDPLQETLIRIRVAKKNRDELACKSTKIIRIFFF